MNQHMMARAPERAIGAAARAWHEARWRARDAARQLDCAADWRSLARMGALMIVIGALVLTVLLALPRQNAYTIAWRWGSELDCATGLALLLAGRWRGRRRG